MGGWVVKGTVMAQADAELIRRCARGEEVAYRELVERLEKPLVNFILRYVGERSQAEDIFQETFVRVVRTMGDFKPEASLSTWIFTIARNLCLDHLKMKKRHREVSMDAGAGGDDGPDFRDALRAAGRSAEDAADGSEQERQLKAAIAKLGPAKREALVMRVFAGLSYQEIARISDAPVGTIKFRVHEAVGDLTAMLAAKPASDQAAG